MLQAKRLLVPKSARTPLPAPKAATPFCRAACPAAYPVSPCLPSNRCPVAQGFVSALIDGGLRFQGHADIAGCAQVVGLLIRRHVASLAACRRAVNGVYSAKVDMYGTE